MPLSGATQTEIQSHYDRGEDFYRLWLGEERVYSCATWDEDVRNLDEAQARKLHRHLDNLHLSPGAVILDIGCGWGSLLRRALRDFAVQRAIGLTLSEDQCRSIRDEGHRGTDVRLESWTDHQPPQPYDGIVSIGAFEHFARPEHTQAEKAAIYRSFFEKCHAWLKPGARLSLQTIAYGSLPPEQASAFMQNVIFPGSELPRADEIIAAAAPSFGPAEIRSDGEHYARTCEAWLRNLQRNRTAAAALVGADTVQTYERYLRLSAVGFRTGRIVLLRMLFRRAES